jgi:hypothetical protein
MPDDNKTTKEEIATRNVRLPGFLVAEPIGLGDVVKRATGALGITPCGGCMARAARLNRWMAFSGRQTK